MNLAKTHVILHLLLRLLLFFYFKPPKITEFIHKFPFGKIILLTDLYFYDCETELFSMNQVGVVHPNQYAMYGVEKILEI